ncbi:MAG: hypothetical protein V1855_02390 [bacterium]
MLSGKFSRLLTLTGLMGALFCITSLHGQITVAQIEAAKTSPQALETLLMNSYGHTYEDDVKDAFFSAIQENFERLKTVPTTLFYQTQKSEFGKLMLLSRNATHLLKPDQIGYINATILPVMPQFMGAFTTTATPTPTEQKIEVVELPTEELPALPDLTTTTVEQTQEPQVETPAVTEPEVSVSDETKAITDTATEEDFVDKNLGILQAVLAKPNENEQIQDLYSVMQQAVGNVFDAKTKNFFAQTLVQVFNKSRVVSLYLAQLIKAATQTTLLNEEQRNYVATQMLPLVAVTAPSIKAKETAETPLKVKKAKKKGKPGKLKKPKTTKKGTKVKKTKKKKAQKGALEQPATAKKVKKAKKKTKKGALKQPASTKKAKTTKKKVKKTKKKKKAKKTVTQEEVSGPPLA